jgi:hypothetical protein
MFFVCLFITFYLIFKNISQNSVHVKCEKWYSVISIYNMPKRTDKLWEWTNNSFHDLFTFLSWPTPQFICGYKQVGKTWKINIKLVFLVISKKCNNSLVLIVANQRSQFWFTITPRNIIPLQIVVNNNSICTRFVKVINAPLDL